MSRITELKRHKASDYKRCEVITKPGVRYIKPDRCQNSACYIVDGVSMCQRHAQVHVFESFLALKNKSSASNISVDWEKCVALGFDEIKRLTPKKVRVRDGFFTNEADNPLWESIARLEQTVSTAMKEVGK